MDVEFDDDDLDDLEVNPRATCGFSPAVVKGYRKAMQVIRGAVDERDLYAMKGLRFEKLIGKRKEQRSLRCNDQYRLIIQLIGDGRRKKVRVMEIVDYH
jgi:proteic killer suppression protein